VRRLPPILWALPALGLARLLPEHGVGLYVRLAAATTTALIPGALAARALGRREASVAVAWALALLFGALAITFAASASLGLTLILLAAVSVALLPLSGRPAQEPHVVGFHRVLFGGLLFGVALWAVSGHASGDGLFHLARVRKLDAFGDLSLGSVNEFADGDLHPGYAFPLWHGFLALVGRLAGVDPTAVIEHEASALAPLAFLVVFEAGVVLFRSAALGGAVLVGHLALTSLSSDHGGAFASLALPATASRLLLVPAALTTVFAFLHAPSRGLLASTAAAGFVLTLVHPTYAIFLALPLAGFLVVRALVAVREAPRIVAATFAVLAPGAGVILWLLPLARKTASYGPDAAELERALSLYAGQVDVVSETAYRLAPAMLSRSGSAAVAALALLPLAALAARRRWAAWVLGGSLAVLLVMLAPELFTRFSDAVSLSQSRRAASFVPFAFAFAGGAAVVVRLLGAFSLPLAVGAGIWLQLEWPGDFTLRLERGGGPGGLTWFALVGGIVALVVAVTVARRAAWERAGWLAAWAAALFVLPTAAHAAGVWGPSPERRREPLTPGLIQALRERVPEGAVVFSDLETSYRAGAYAPVYVAAAPPAHVADNEANRPYERRRDVMAFFRSGDLAIPRRYGAGWLVVDLRRFDVRPDLPAAYRNGRYALYRLD
jgi:hypothetical protein